ncbi:hypothetical protein TNCV_786281 [Trichonephila clavipes]|nr:hypothetical protein TNCV_786281 [Trichonephila clavipes]
MLNIFPLLADLHSTVMKHTEYHFAIFYHCNVYLPIVSPQSQGSDTKHMLLEADSPQPCSQVELNDPTRDLGLSGGKAEFSGSRLEGEKNLLVKGTEEKNLSTLRKTRIWSIVQIFQD